MSVLKLFQFSKFDSFADEVDSLNSVMNSDVADTDGVKARIELQIQMNIFRNECTKSNSNHDNIFIFQFKHQLRQYERHQNW